LGAGVLELREIRRFANEPVRQNGSLCWDVLLLWHEMGQALANVADTRLASIGVDGWGCDYALIGERGNLLENPYHYRDVRSHGMMEAASTRREKIYATTGIQCLQSRCSALRGVPPDAASRGCANALITIPTC
jgi:sugar (pentulose or hexulose) kinase